MKFLTWQKLWFSISTILIIAAIASLATWGLRIGIDFSGGQLLEAQFSDQAKVETIREGLNQAQADELIPSYNISSTSADSFLIRISADDQQLNNLRSSLDKVGEWQEIRFENVGPTVGKDLTRKAIIGVILASVAIILYIAWAFRQVPPPTNSWQFGLTAIIALLHDLIITIGGFAALGHFLGYEVDSLFITAILTVLGFSVHDTIVTYDRIRENLLTTKNEDFSTIVNSSVEQTVVRSLSTSLTLILVLLSLILLGGSSIRPFISALLIGVVVGTYSSIFIAAQLLIVWQKRAVKKNS